MSGTIGDNVYRASGVIAAAAGGGAVSWDTATIKTTGFTAEAGIGYFCNTTGGSFTVTLPAAPAAGDMIGIKDYLNTFDTNALTIGRNSKPIESESLDAVLLVEGDDVVLIFMDDTVGWKIISHAAKEDLAFPTYIAATGGTEATSGDYKIHVFTANACFTVTTVGNASGSNTVCYMVAGGGGGGAGPNPKGGGGGAGGWRASGGTTAGSYCAGPAPLVNGVAAIPVSSPVSYPVAIGAGGAATAVGSAASFSTITSAGGGGTPGGSGGSGGGNTGSNSPNTNGNQPPVSPIQGYPGGWTAGGGATGAGTTNYGFTGSGAGTDIYPCAPVGGGGPGDVPSSLRYFSGGGFGGEQRGWPNTGCGTPEPAMRTTLGFSAPANSGGGGGASAPGRSPTTPGAGGSGVVILRYKYQ